MQPTFWGTLRTTQGERKEKKEERAFQFFSVLGPRGKGTLFKKKEPNRGAQTEMKGKARFLTPNYFLRGVSRTHEHLMSPLGTEAGAGTPLASFPFSTAQRGAGGEGEQLPPRTFLTLNAWREPPSSRE